MLELRNLTKGYVSEKGDMTIAVRDVNLVFPDKGMIFIVGKSGSGKSTLLNLIGGIDMPDKGEIIADGKSIRDFTPVDYDAYRNSYIGFIFQEYNLLNEFNLKKNILLASELQGKDSSEKLDGLLGRTGMEKLSGRRPNELSGGQKQRAAITRALIKNPEVILADEPTGNLDSATGEQIFKLMRELSAERLFIIVSHNTEAAGRYADRIITMSDGNVAGDVKNEPGDLFPDELKIIEDTIILPERELKNAEIDIINGNPGKKLVYASDVNAPAAKEKDTIPEPPPVIREYKASKSRLPIKSLTYLGLNNFKLKPLKMFVAVVLTVISLVFLGLAATAVTYGPHSVKARIYDEKGINSVALIAAKLNDYGYLNESSDPFTDNRAAELAAEYPGISFDKVYRLQSDMVYTMDMTGISEHFQFIFGEKLTVIDQARLGDYGLSILYGVYPAAGSGEIAITDFTADYLIEKDLIASRDAAVGYYLTAYNQQAARVSCVLKTDYENRYSEGLNKVYDSSAYYDYLNEEEIRFYYNREYVLKNYYSPDITLLTDIQNLKNNYVRYNDWEFYNADYSEFSAQSLRFFRMGETTYTDYSSLPELNLTGNEVLLNVAGYVSVFGSSDGYDTAIYPIEAEYRGQAIIIVGVYASTTAYGDVLSPELFAEFPIEEYTPEYYQMMVSLSNSRSANKKFFADEEDNLLIEKSPYSEYLYGIYDMMHALTYYFFVIGMLMLAISILLQSSLIYLNIEMRRKEIGILRALGASRSDTMKIFIFEGGALAILNVLLSIIFMFILTATINGYILGLGKLFTGYDMSLNVLRPTLIAVALMIFVSAFITAIAVISPIRKYNKMRPADVIKGL